MSDRTEVTDPAVTGASTPQDGRPGDPSAPGATGPTRADRVMGRARDGGRDAAGPATRPAANGTSGSAGAPTEERAARGAAATQPGQRATPVAEAPGRGAGAERSGTGPGDGWGRSGTSRPGAAPAQDEAPTRVNPAAAGDEPTRTIAGAGALGAVSRSMDEPTQPVPTGARTGRGDTAAAAATDEDTLTPPSKRAAPRGAGRKSRRARLRLSRIDPWSVMKTSFLFSIALGIAGWVLVAFVWWIIQQSGLFGAVNTIVADMFSAPGDADPFRLEAYVNGSRVLGLAALLAVVDVLLITAIATVASFLYNLSATMLGGLQVTLAETDD